MLLDICNAENVANRDQDGLPNPPHGAKGEGMFKHIRELIAAFRVEPTEELIWIQLDWKTWIQVPKSECQSP